MQQFFAKPLEAHKMWPSTHSSEFEISLFHPNHL
jgi:hypothetical protein